jgi:hypothetical protein
MGGAIPAPLFPKPAKEKTMDYEMNGFNEGLPDIECLAIVAMDATGTMGGKERKSGVEKHLCAAMGVQKILDDMDDPQYENACISVVCFSASLGGVQILSLLDCHKPYEAKTYTGNTDLELWDGLSAKNCALGMGGGTPIGSALRWAREIGEQWGECFPGPSATARRHLPNERWDEQCGSRWPGRKKSH